MTDWLVRHVWWICSLLCCTADGRKGKTGFLGPQFIFVALEGVFFIKKTFRINLLNIQLDRSNIHQKSERVKKKMTAKHTEVVHNKWHQKMHIANLPTVSYDGGTLSVQAFVHNGVHDRPVCLPAFFQQRSIRTKQFMNDIVLCSSCALHIIAGQSIMDEGRYSHTRFWSQYKQRAIAIKAFTEGGELSSLQQNLI